MHPTEAARAWHLHEEEGLGLRDVRKEVTNMAGETPSLKAVWHAIRMVIHKSQGLRTRTMFCDNA